ncbi:MAG TPA: polysaccharide ABC transporter ATP-binding protein [Saprospiraceae bacterium]|nr:polysaccharide ABC transporter ATP-binding protein [Saprospiraceae bacterium]HNT19439.1 polysaccharide ABC transporter ATP-binding protein [Saprospiraceae bacterium]
MPVITAENLSKKFVIAHESRERYTALRDVMARGVKKIFSFPGSLWSGSTSRATKEEFWALKDLNFEINQGDRVGIIGRNGAGKSTLLKILSRITPPTEGKVTIKGRVASLLEVGTGFHPELTGRENIFLNGAILGMSRAEIRKKFDEIVAFAEVEKFLDTPVKRYSSGMYVRLAFSVAAHLEPEILIVDEVLAVGDAQFQKKCLGKMEDVSKNEGRTVLFVSHQFESLRAFCNTGVLLANGILASQSSLEECIEVYQRSTNVQRNCTYTNDDGLFFKKMILKEDQIQIGNSITIKIAHSLKYNPNNLIIAVNIKNEFGETITQILNVDNKVNSISKPGEFNIEIQNLNFIPGIYNIALWVGFDMINEIEKIDNVLQFEVSNQNFSDRHTPFSKSLKTFHKSKWESF